MAAPDGDLATDLAAWLSELFSAATGELGSDEIDLRSPTGGGWSNETYLVEVKPLHTSVVVRLEPERASMFPHYDLGRQLWCLSRLQTEATVPTPKVIGHDLAGHRLGRPAFVMERVVGRIPSDDTPTFAEAGWLRNATAQQQERFHCGLLDALANLHAVPIDAEGRRLLAPPDGPTCAGALADLGETWQFDQGTMTPPGVERAFADLAEALPDGGLPNEDPVFLWGDARPANVVVAHDSFDPIGLLDWELASVGPAELDVIWLEEMNWLRIEGAGNAPLPGFLDGDDAIAHYSERTGRRLTDLDWHRRFAALRVAVLMHRYLRGLVHAGQLDAEHRIFGDTVASRRLAQLWS